MKKLRTTSRTPGGLNPGGKRSVKMAFSPDKCPSAPFPAGNKTRNRRPMPPHGRPDNNSAGALKLPAPVSPVHIPALLAQPSGASAKKTLFFPMPRLDMDKGTRPLHRAWEHCPRFHYSLMFFKPFQITQSRSAASFIYPCRTAPGRIR